MYGWSIHHQIPQRMDHRYISIIPQGPGTEPQDGGPASAGQAEARAGAGWPGSRAGATTPSVSVTELEAMAGIRGPGRMTPVMLSGSAAEIRTCWPVRCCLRMER